MDTSETKSYRLILDGQQRLTSLFVLMEGEAPPFYEGTPGFRLYFNVLKEEFAYYKKSQMLGNVEWIPRHAVLQGRTRGLHPRSRQRRRRTTAANFVRLKRLDDIKDYLYYQKDLTELEMDRVVVFNLVNSTGTRRLGKSDLALAHIALARST
ncbi:MAG: hypothetical protein WKF78_02815 [Candidatus Limnocylindrales bacterium]